MNTASQKDWRSWAILLLGVAGCQGLGDQRIPQDPLLAARKPVTGKLVSAAPVDIMVANVEPPHVPLAIESRPSYALNRPISGPDHVVFLPQPDATPMLDLSFPRPRTPTTLTSFPREIRPPIGNE